MYVRVGVGICSVVLPKRNGYGESNGKSAEWRVYIPHLKIEMWGTRGLGGRWEEKQATATAKTTAGSFDYAQHRLFDFSTHGKTVSAFAQDDNSLMEVGKNKGNGNSRSTACGEG